MGLCGPSEPFEPLFDRRQLAVRQQTGHLREETHRTPRDPLEVGRDDAPGGRSSSLVGEHDLPALKLRLFWQNDVFFRFFDEFYDDRKYGTNEWNEYIGIFVVHIVLVINDLAADTHKRPSQRGKMPKDQAMTTLGGPIALMKAHSSKVFEYCAREARQIFGGNAYTRSGLGEKAERETPWDLRKQVIFKHGQLKFFLNRS